MHLMSWWRRTTQMLHGQGTGLSGDPRSMLSRAWTAWRPTNHMRREPRRAAGLSSCPKGLLCGEASGTHVKAPEFQRRRKPLHDAFPLGSTDTVHALVMEGQLRSEGGTLVWCSTQSWARRLDPLASR